MTAGRAQLEAAGIRWPDLGNLQVFGPVLTTLTSEDNSQPLMSMRGPIGRTRGVLTTSAEFEVPGSARFTLVTGNMGETWIMSKNEIFSTAMPGVSQMLNELMDRGWVQGLQFGDAYPIDANETARPEEVARLGEVLEELSGREG
jgi:hypothetical protein